jgi:hypothetical protein
VNYYKEVKFKFTRGDYLEVVIITNAVNPLHIDPRIIIGNEGSNIEIKQSDLEFIVKELRSIQSENK